MAKKSGHGQAKISARTACGTFSLYCLLSSRILVMPLHSLGQSQFHYLEEGGGGGGGGASPLDETLNIYV